MPIVSATGGQLYVASATSPNLSMFGPMRIATWNVNSVRSRIERVEALLQRQEIDVLALQETKAKDDQFPTMGLQALGYEVAMVGYNQWNGVAILSRVGLDGRRGRVPRHARVRRSGGARGPGDRRHLRRRADLVALRPQRPQARRPALPLQAALAGGAAGVGRGVAPGVTRPARSRWSGTGTSRRSTRTSTTSKDFKNSTHVTPQERAAFFAFEDLGMSDVTRRFTPGPGVYTYWDYFRQSFERNRGLRIDFVLGSARFADRVTDAFIDTEERAGAGASDHAPVIVDLAD